MYKCEELNKLANYLTNNNIQWENASDDDIERIHFETNGYAYSCINGLSTYGGWNRITKHNEGLIEFYNYFEEPIGHLTCDDVIKIIEGNK